MVSRRHPGAWLVAALLLASCERVDRSAQLANGNAVQPAAPMAPAPDAPPVDTGPAFPALTGRVVDEAGILEPDEEAGLADRLAALEGRTTDQLVVATVPSLQGLGIDDFSQRLGNHWGIGRADRSNGVLLVVAPQERRVRIAVGYGLEPILTNARSSEIIERDLLPAFRQGRWNEGISAGVDSIIATLVAEADTPRRGRR